MNKNYTLLSGDNQEKVRIYTENLLKVQQAEEAAEKAQHNDAPKTLCCSFCGKDESEVPFLIIGKTGNICTDCLDVCRSFIERQPELLK